MARKAKVGAGAKRRRFDREFKEQAVQMLVDGHSAESVRERLGLGHANILYHWKRQILGRESAVAQSLEGRVRQLEEELRQVERERDVLKKALAIFSRGG